MSILIFITYQLVSFSLAKNKNPNANSANRRMMQIAQKMFAKFVHLFATFALKKERFFAFLRRYSFSVKSVPPPKKMVNHADSK